MVPGMPIDEAKLKDSLCHMGVVFFGSLTIFIPLAICALAAVGMAVATLNGQIP